MYVLIKNSYSSLQYLAILQGQFLATVIVCMWAWQWCFDWQLLIRLTYVSAVWVYVRLSVN